MTYTPCGCLAWKMAEEDRFAWVVPMMNSEGPTRLAPKVGDKKRRAEVIYCPWCGKCLKVEE